MTEQSDEWIPYINSYLLIEQTAGCEHDLDPVLGHLPRAADRLPCTEVTTSQHCRPLASTMVV